MKSLIATFSVIVVIFLSFLIPKTGTAEFRGGQQGKDNLDSVQFWKNKTRAATQQALEMLKHNQEELARHEKLNNECILKNESLVKLINEQKKEIEKLKN